MARPVGRSSKETRKSLLAAGAKMFALKGFAGTSIREIAEEANLQSAMIAYYFKNKAGLYKAVIDEMYERMNQVIVEHLPNAPYLLQHLDEAARVVWGFATANKNTMRIMIQHALEHDPKDSPQSMKNRITVLKQVSQQLATLAKIPYPEARTLLLTVNYYISRLTAERESDLRETFDLKPGDDLDQAMEEELTRFLQNLLQPIIHRLTT